MSLGHIQTNDAAVNEPQQEVWHLKGLIQSFQASDASQFFWRVVVRRMKCWRMQTLGGKRDKGWKLVSETLIVSNMKFYILTFLNFLWSNQSRALSREDRLHFVSSSKEMQSFLVWFLYNLETEFDFALSSRIMNHRVKTMNVSTTLST